MITKKIGKIIRGKITPFQIMLGCFFGMLLGFLPGFFTAPGLYFLAFILVMILNVNLILCAILAPIAKLMYFILLPLIFQTGQFFSHLLEPVLKVFVNMPVIAWFGLEYYVTIGGLVWGIFFGLIAGIWLNKLVKSIREKIVDLDENSVKYKEWQEKKLVKLFKWILFGKKGKHSYQELLDKKVGNPIRILGIVGVVCFLIVLYSTIQFTRNDVLKYVLVNHLENLNGATVDVNKVKLSMTHAKLEIQELAFANPESLDENRLVLKSFTADFDIDAFLKRSIVFEVIEIGEVLSDQKRTSKAVIVKSSFTADPEANLTGTGTESSLLGGEYSSIDEYFKKYKEITKTLEPYEEWGKKIYQQIKTSKTVEKMEADKKEKMQNPEAATSLEQMLKSLAKEQGYESIFNPNLLVRKPIFQINLVDIQSVKIPQPVLENSQIKLRYLSSYPASLESPLSLELNNDARKIYATLSFDSLMEGHDLNAIDLRIDQIDGEKIGRELKIQNNFPLKKGDLKLSLKGGWSFGMVVDLKGELQLNKGLIEYEGNQLEVDELIVPLEMKGTVYKPSIKVNGKNLSKQIADIAKDRLKNQAKKEIKKVIEEGKEELNHIIENGVNRENIESSTQKLLDKQKDKTKGNPLKDLFKK